MTDPRLDAVERFYDFHPINAKQILDAVAARGITGIRIADTIFGALAQAVPHILPACGANAPDVGISTGGVDTSGKAFVYLEFLLGSWGGGPHRDGMDACTGTLVNYSNTPAEMIAAGLPARAESPWGREAQSIAFFKAPGAEALYSGVTINRASAASICSRRSSTDAGIESGSRSSLKPGISSRPS